MSTSTFHANFKRITAGENVTAITSRTGLDQGSISRYLNGRRVPNLSRLARIAEAYQVDPSEFFLDPSKSFKQTKDAA